jgi:isopentenyl-diphosphate Delta-isomerase
MVESPELVVLVAEDGTPVGTAAKAEVHTTDTALHLAFSCHVFNRAGQILVTRRALEKKTWPGVWTNSFCGHPAPGEDFVEAIHRRAEYELGLKLASVKSALPDFRYRAVDASGIVENEICPVFIATVDDEPVPNPSEVAEYAWADPEELLTSVEMSAFAFSPWLILQLPRLAVAGYLSPAG